MQTLRPLSGAIALLFAWAALAQPIAAQLADGLTTQPFDPAPNAAADGFTTQSASLLPAQGWLVSASAVFAVRPLHLDSPERFGADYAGPYSGDVLTSQTTMHAIGAYGAADWLQVAIDLPLVAQQAGDSRTGLIDPRAADSAAGLGDLRVSSKLRIYDTEPASSQHGLRFALTLDAGLPTGAAERYQGGRSRLTALGIGEWVSPFGARVLVNAGYVVRSDPSDVPGDGEQGNNVRWSAALQVPVWQDRLSAIMDVVGDVTTELLLGARASMHDVHVVVAAGPGLSDNALTPDWRALLSVGYRGGAGDKVHAVDRDAAPLERCPSEELGRCPDIDDDDDGIVDARDRCPASAEDADGFEDGDGCPELDNDGDGIADAADRCALDPEDADGELDDDGCPDIDPGVRVDVVLFFATESVELSAESRLQLDRIARTLVLLPDDMHVWINGHADDRGEPAYNEQLGMRRAQAAQRYLIAHHVPPERLTAQSYGDTKNIVLGDNEVDRLVNRRVTFRVGPRSLVDGSSSTHLQEPK